ncbi:MAG: tetratricopeptide repeat protein [Chloroflexota bacterium]|nr:tetratricopeptide repeat protein [Chloroflexota bacterium]
MSEPLIHDRDQRESGDMTTRTLSDHPQPVPAAAQRSRGRLRSLTSRLWFPIALIVAIAVAFVVVGPLSSPQAGPGLNAMAPAGAAPDEPFVAAADATPTEQEIAQQYETVRQYPDTVDAYALLGFAYLQNVREKGDPADYGRAEAALDEALRRDADNVNALIGKGSLAAAQHEFHEALELGNRAVGLAPHTARTHGVVVDALTELGRYDEALVATQTMVDLRPDLASYSRVSYQRELHGQVDGAILAMEQAFSASVGSPTENREYLRVLMGDLRLLKGDLEAAEQVYEASLQASPGFVWALNGLAGVRAFQGDFDEAVELQQQAVDTIPLPEFVIALGEIQEAAGRTEDAQRSYELVEAIQQLFEANGVNVDLDLALFQANHGDDPAAAVELARRAYESEPNIKAADAFGWALYGAGQYDEARRYADEALRLGTPYGSFLYHAGMIAQAQGDTAAARDFLSRALELDPYFSPLYAPLAAQALEGLGSD